MEHFCRASSEGRHRARARGGPHCVLALAAVLGSPLWAAETELRSTNLADLSFDELMQTKVATVYAASKRHQAVAEAPASVTILTSDDLRQYGHRTLADALRSVPGFYVTYDRMYSFIGVRGLNRPGDFGGRVLVMVDGHRLNEPIYDQAFNGGEFPLDVDLIDRVEIIRGPGSSLYGNNALLAVVNVIPRRGADVGGVEASAAVASYETYSGRLTYGQRFTNGLDLLISGTLFDSAGHDRLYYPEFQAINRGVAEGLDGESVQRVFLSLGYKGFSLAGAFSDRQKEVPTAPYATTVFNRGPIHAQDERDFLEARYARELPRDWRVLARVFVDRYRYDGLWPTYGTAPPDPAVVVFNEDLSLAHFWGGEVQAGKVVAEKHQLTFGAEFRDDFEIRQRNRDLAPPFLYGDVRSDGDTFGLYAQDEWALRTNLLLNAGLRYDHFPTFGGTVNPRAALIYSPVPPTTFKLLYGQAYRAPNAYEADYRAVGYAPNPDLEPERLRSYELVWEQQLTRPLRLRGSFFFNDLHDLITQQVDPSSGDYLFRNTDKVHVRGAEAQLEGRWPGGLRGRLSYTFAEARDEGTGARLSNAPRHLGKLSLVVPVYADKLFAGLEVQGMTARRTVQGTETDGFAVANFTLFSREWVKNLEVSLSLYNLWNQRYADPVGPDYWQAAIGQDGRTFRVKVTYRF